MYKDKSTSLAGVAGYLQIKYKHLFVNKDPNQVFSTIHKLQIKFLKENNLKVIDKLSDWAGDKNAITIQENFTLFTQWCKQL